MRHSSLLRREAYFNIGDKRELCSGVCGEIVGGKMCGVGMECGIETLATRRKGGEATVEKRVREIWTRLRGRHHFLLYAINS
ncbi:hypothetical protein NDU88_005916 [Pleurodeles waltl]|uniref:Uncharacterized protein n=1 Tax=Pleurodeles waltl TaxID=8319 RepID=A0AAV7PJZ9_PLEWA|nr:hypothetical protein NDU88_005916 [Pleurodeles waltl]